MSDGGCRAVGLIRLGHGPNRPQRPVAVNGSDVTPRQVNEDPCRRVDVARRLAQRTDMANLAEITAEAQREAILEALRRSNGHRGEAAASLGVPRRTFASRIQRLGMAEVIRKEGKRLGWPPPTARATAARKSLT